jgi:phosphomannomutase
VPEASKTTDLSTIIKAYDVRGLVPEQLDASIARAIGAAFAEVSGAAAAPADRRSVVVGYDMRPSSPALVAAFAEGVNSRGVDVVDIGLASTDQLYFASGRLDLPGAMFTASHNPAQYNGIKMCRAGATPIGQDTGLAEIRALAEADLDGAPRTAPAAVQGTLERRDLLTDYAAFLLELVDLHDMRPLSVVVDAGNGMGGHTVPAVFASLPVRLEPLYFELDGTFPNHEANPIEAENLRDLQAAVRSHDADVGLAFDGDADRCFVVDERGEIVSPSDLTALIAARELAKHPGSAVIHNLITSWSVAEVVRENGGTPVRTRVGHSFIKSEMAATNAVFGGEHSGHFYFRDFWRADSGMLAALHLLAALGEAPEGTTVSSLLAPYQRYTASGEINSTVDDQAAAAATVRAEFAQRPDVTLDDLDGLTVAGADWWFNLRPSNTEPLLRLNVEARDAGTMETVRDEVLTMIRGAHV